ncbi:MAG: hypothetical protein WB992_19485 [Bryobacteraceae bacterium]
MTKLPISLPLCVAATMLFSAFSSAQGPVSPATIQTAVSTVPRLVSFSGVIKDAGGKPVTGPVSVTFSLFAEQEGGSPLWSESQIAEVDAQGSYTVHLGASNPAGLPLDLFTTGAARWLAVQPDAPGVADLSRVLLVGVPYALKAADADTLGGKPASAYVTVENTAATGQVVAAAASQANETGMMHALTAPANTPGACSPVTSDGAATANSIALFTTACNIEASPLFAVSGKVGLDIATPSAYFDVYPSTTAFAGSATVTAQAVRGNVTANPSSASYGIYEGVRGQANDVGATNRVGTLKGFMSSAGTSSNQTVDALYGLFSQAQVSKTGGTAAAAYGIYANTVETTGNLTTGYGLFAQAQGAMTTAYGVYSSVTSYSSGKPTTGYGVYIAPLSVTGSSFGLYQGGSNDKNYFAGNLGLGTTTPSALLEVNGTAKFDGAVTFAGAETSTGNVSTSGQLISTVATGTAPLSVASTTQVSNLNASLLGGKAASAFASIGANTFTGNQSVTGSISASGNVSAGGTVGGTFGYFSGSIEASGTGYGIQGIETNDVNQAVGILGLGEGRTKQTIGVEGFAYSPAGVGVYGDLLGESNTGSELGLGLGVWGDTSQSNTIGVLGTADDGYAAYFANNGSYAALSAFNNSSNSAEAFKAGGNSGNCTIDTSGDLACTGSKSAVVPVDNGTRKVALYAVEAPENWFEDFGSGELSGGAVTITLEPTFAQSVNTDVEYHVFLTPNGDCKGLYVSNKTAHGFAVRELSGGQSNVAFDYRIVARRKGYETIRLADKTKEFERMKLPQRNAGVAKSHPR